MAYRGTKPHQIGYVRLFKQEYLLFVVVLLLLFFLFLKQHFACVRLKQSLSLSVLVS